MGKTLDILNKLEVKEFDWLDGTHDIGLIAEEVEKILPEAVWYKDDKVEGLKPLTLIAVIIEAIKELQDGKNKLG
jgi:hypothetical protein